MWRAWGLVQGPPGSGSWSQDSIPVSLTSESGGSCVLPAQPAVLMERPVLSIRWRKTSAVLKGGLATPLVQQDEPELLLGPLPHAHLHFPMPTSTWHQISSPSLEIFSFSSCLLGSFQAHRPHSGHAQFSFLISTFSQPRSLHTSALITPIDAAEAKSDP